MNNADNLQLELFSQAGSDTKLNSASGGNSFFKSMRANEKTILIIIGLAVTGIVAFSFGVENGKGLSAQRIQEPQQSLQAGQLQAQSIVVKQAIKKSVPDFLPPVKPVKKEQSQDVQRAAQGYTIQLASYKTKENAQKEALSLKKKGFSPLVLSRGSYVVLCVGSFLNKETAQPVLSKLQKSYSGCYIRRL